MSYSIKHLFALGGILTMTLWCPEVIMLLGASDDEDGEPVFDTEGPLDEPVWEVVKPVVVGNAPGCVAKYWHGVRTTGDPLISKTTEYSLGSAVETHAAHVEKKLSYTVGAYSPLTEQRHEDWLLNSSCWKSGVAATQLELTLSTELQAAALESRVTTAGDNEELGYVRDLPEM